MKSERVIKLCALTLLLGMGLLPGNALAAGFFTPIIPATCPGMTEVDWHYNLSNSGTQEWMVPDDPNQRGNYISNVNYTVGIVANWWVNSFGFRVDSFSTEPNYDYLKMGTTGINAFLLTGTPGTGWYDYVSAHEIGQQDTYLQFVSDRDVTSSGIAIGRARVCTNNVPGAPAFTHRQMVATRRYTGVLLGENDVVYFTVPVGSTKPGAPCGNAHDTFALWGASTGQDIDLHVRCGAYPTDTQFDYASEGGGSQEFIHADPAKCTCGGTWYVSVSQYSSGAPGFFNLVNHKHYASEHRSQLEIRAEKDLLASEFTPIQAEMTRGVRHFFGANEGARYWDTYRLVDKTTGAGEVRIHAGSDRPNSDLCGSQCGGLFADCNINLFSNQYDGPTLSHEMGHHFNCLRDEYADGAGTYCGHSIMGSQFFTNNNYCYCNSQGGTGRCNEGQGDHQWDSSPPGIGPQTGRGTAWMNLSARSPVEITQTPDNYDYVQFDFAGKYASPIIVNQGNQ